jgi:hypothetical protein
MRRIAVVALVALAVAACDEDPVAVDGIVLPAPTVLSSISLDGAIHLSWSDNPFNSDPGGFLEYRVYSTGYSIDEDLCDEAWESEGTSIAPEFLAAALTNGEPRCYGVVAVSIDGLESEFSPIRADTPRPDARNVLMFAFQTGPTLSGFLFFDDVNGNGVVEPLELGNVGDGARLDIDFWIDRDPSGDFFFVPERVETEIALYSAEPLEDLTSIDLAPVGGYSRDAIQAVPRFGYVFEIDGGDGFFRYGAIRVTHVGAEYMIFDWSYQTDPGNPELSVHGGAPVAEETGITVIRR